jgi:uncharacterized protein (TIRG00374 family)
MCLYLALRGLNWASFVSTLRNASYGYLPLIFIWGSTGSWIRALRWHLLLTAEKNIPSKNVFWANMAGYLGNTVLPARAGEFVRALYLGRENNISTAFSLATGFVERIVDLIALIILGSVSLSIAEILSKPLQDALKIVSTIAMIGFIATLVLPYLTKRLSHVILILPVLNTSAKEKITVLLEHFLSGIEALYYPKRAAAFVLFTSLIWLMDGIGILFLAHTLHMQFTITQAFLLLASLGLSSAIPSTPGYIGIYQYVAVIVLQPFGVSNASALAFIIFLQVLNILIIAFWGGLAIWRSSSLVQLSS